MQISLVIPLLNEKESLPELAQWIATVMEQNHFSYEILFIDDGSTDGSWDTIQELRAANPNVKGVRFRRNYGKSAALNTGFDRVKGDVIITMDADLQDSPEEIPALYEMIVKDGFDLVSGWKKKRFDPISKTIPTKFYNAVTRMMSGVKLNDMNCGLKAYSHQVVKSIEVYGEMHRYIPVIAKWAGFTKIGEKVVQHQARKHGTSKFGISRFINGPLDLASIMFVGKLNKLYALANDLTAKNIATQSSFYIALTAMIMGVQLFLTGFLAELVTRNAPERNNYQIQEIID